ncbi:MAG: hypothetical protein WDM81_08960 [Rhizomicrobium sp.]
MIGARAVILRGVSPPLAFASAITDVTTELMAQIVFVLVGIGLCIEQLRGSATTAPYVDGLILGTLLCSFPASSPSSCCSNAAASLPRNLAGRFLPAAIEHTRRLLRPDARDVRIQDAPRRLLHPPSAVLGSPAPG